MSSDSLIQRYREQLHLTLQRYARELLLIEMREISEEHWFAGWLGGLEFRLWDLAINGTPIDKGFVDAEDVDPEEIKHLRDRLSELHFHAQGWWAWDDDEHQPVFLPESQWLARLAERSKGKGASNAPPQG